MKKIFVAGFGLLAMGWRWLTKYGRGGKKYLGAGRDSRTLARM